MTNNLDKIYEFYWYELNKSTDHEYHYKIYYTLGSQCWPSLSIKGSGQFLDHIFWK